MSVYTYKCPHCSGGLNFDPESQSFTCEYCESHFSKEEVEANQPKIDPEEKRMDSEPESDEAVFYSCPSCGAEVLTDRTTAATTCFYCHSSVVLSDRLLGAFRPDAVIPFTIPKEQAIETFLQWTRKKWFLPKDFSSDRQIAKVTGVYFPVWYVDCNVFADLSAKATKIRTWQDHNFRYKETSFYNLSRSGEVRISNIPKKALNKKESELYETVLPFDETKAEMFTTAYLSGFQAEKRNIDSEMLQDEVKNETMRYSRNLFDQTITGYTTVQSANFHINKMNVKWKYTLLPVWTMTYQDLKQTYYYVMNGQTGKLSGKLPVDRKKLGLVSAGISTLIFIVLLLVNRGYLGA